MVDLGKVFARDLSAAKRVVEETSGVLLGRISVRPLMEYGTREKMYLPNQWNVLAATGVRSIYYTEPHFTYDLTDADGTVTLFHELHHMVMIRSLGMETVSDFLSYVDGRILDGTFPDWMCEGYAEYMAVRLARERGIRYDPPANLHQNIACMEQVVREHRLRRHRDVTRYVMSLLE